MPALDIAFVIAVIALTVVALGAVVYLNAKRLPWPKGEQMICVSSLGVEVLVIDAPGSDGERLMLLDACQMATTSLFTAWRAWRPSDVGAETIVPKLGVHFMDEESMDEIGATLYGDRIDAYLTSVSSAFERVPVVAIRRSCAREMIETGQPLMHKLLHVLLQHFVPDAPSDDAPAFAQRCMVEGAAVRTFKDLYSPAAQLQKRRRA